MTFTYYKACLDMHRVSYRTMNIIRTRGYQIYTSAARKPSQPMMTGDTSC